ncbi:MAG: pyruvate formate-lyase, partial [Alistipes sp.]|nr:pyruvate formate-lyase [Candidatus Minthomonas equi]
MMSERITILKDFFFSKGHTVIRKDPSELGLDLKAAEFAAAGTPAQLRSAEMLKAILEAEEPAIFDGERIVATSTFTRIPSYFTDDEWKELKATHYLHESGTLSNIAFDYKTTLEKGLEARKSKVKARIRTADEEGKIFLESIIITIDAIQGFISKYECCARNKGDEELATVLSNIRTN